ncbi:alkaline phosphatase [Sphingomonas paeninsulae]|uniref:Alkaline phosphatase n=1 Tax=Sphingomonas paeninsulae TaxID=2319844 RepID=A0A494TAI0_SPHPE|nr:alkaline phosphatase D family protein [Sphingomonas paeninsulae]AYJ86459.1 alkaline phosphatase [Sphingomonas paeninsulae]
MIRIDRRQLIATSALGLGGLLLPGGALFAQSLSVARGFTHNVASGEPATDSILLWTRFVGDGDSAHIKVEIADTANFTRIVSGGEMITGPWRDWTTKITVDGLSPGKTYHYRFIGEDGSKSPVGRTKTLPTSGVEQFKIGIFSCSNLPVGEFNAYGHAAARDDIDMMLHLGDYFYEYKRGTYPPESPRWDRIQPAEEVVGLTDYRLRYASYRTDPNLQALHNRHPMILSMDDHDSANDSWEGGAQNHRADEGDWTLRKLAAIQAYREWLPIDDIPYQTYDIADLATLFRTDTRLLARSHQPSTARMFESADVPAALAAFKKGPWRDPAVTMMGTTQENWLAHGLKASTAARKKWQLVGVGTIVGETYMPPEASGWLAADATASSKRYTLGGLELAKAGLPFNYDNWGGYPAARARLLGAAQRANANLVIVSGDSHNAWAYDLKNEGKRAGVEFAGHSVSSNGYESSTKGTDPKTIAAAMVRASPELKWCDTSQRGYMMLTLTPTTATNEWVFMQTVATPSIATSTPHTMRVRVGSAMLETV